MLRYGSTDPGYYIPFVFILVWRIMQLVLQERNKRLKQMNINESKWKWFLLNAQVNHLYVGLVRCKSLVNKHIFRHMNISNEIEKKPIEQYKSPYFCVSFCIETNTQANKFNMSRISSEDYVIEKKRQQEQQTIAEHWLQKRPISEVHFNT